MKLINSYKVNVKEPSDLATDGEFLYTVSDKTNRIYKISIEGKIIQEYNFEGDDLEGITFDKRDDSFWICEERKKEIVHVDKTGKILSKHKVDIPSKNEKSGLEGICINTFNNNIWVVNEKKPSLLIELNTKLEIIQTTKLNFADDFSGLYFDSITKILWMVSDESKCLIGYNPENQSFKKYDIDVQKAEGVAKIGDFFYVIDDENSILYKYIIS